MSVLMKQYLAFSSLLGNLAAFLSQRCHLSEASVLARQPPVNARLLADFLYYLSPL